jgi:ferrous iron transport protein A
MLQLSFRSGRSRQRRRRHALPSSLGELREGEHGILERLDLPKDIAQRLMELGFLPGSRVTAARSAPSGDPRVFRVDGSEIALRRETADLLKLRINTTSTKELP